MNKQLKIFIATLMSFALMVCMVLPAYANDLVSPCGITANNMNVYISFDENNGYADGMATMDADAELIEGELYIYKLVDNRWVRVGSAYDSVTSGNLSISLDFEAESGVTYWAVFTVTETTAEGEIVDSVDVEETCP